MDSHEKEDQKLKLATTYYCNHTNHEIQTLAANLTEVSGDGMPFVQRAFRFVREEIVLGLEAYQLFWARTR